MGLHELEAMVLRSARIVFCNRKLRQKDIVEWSNGDPKPEAGEVVADIPGLGVRVVIKAEHDKRGKP